MESEAFEKVKASIQFQYMPDENRRPIDGADNTQTIDAEDGQLLHVPDIGDTVSYQSYKYDYTPEGRLIGDSGRAIRVARKVKTRHYSYFDDFVAINIVVVDVPDGEMGLRLKE
jgi:hypothetical protein